MASNRAASEHRLFTIQLKDSSKRLADDWARAVVDFEQSMDRAREHLTQSPTRRDALNKYKPLQGVLAYGSRDGRDLPRWQWDIGSAERMWVLVDTRDFIVFVERISFKHPKETERPRRRKR